MADAVKVKAHAGTGKAHAARLRIHPDLVGIGQRQGRLQGRLIRLAVIAGGKSPELAHRIEGHVIGTTGVIVNLKGLIKQGQDFRAQSAFACFV